jgi:hypothetical protein
MFVRVSIAELETRAATRKPGYIEAIKAAAKPDPQSAAHLLIDASILNDLRHRYSDILDMGHICCGG